MGGVEGGLHAEAQPRVVGFVADLQHVDRGGVELDAVVGVDGCEVAGDLCEVFGGDGGADCLGVDVLGGAPGSVDGEQDSALEDEVARVGAQGESVEE